MTRKIFALISIAVCGFGLVFTAVPALADLEDDYRDFPSDINLFDPGNPNNNNNNNGGNNGGGNGGGGGASVDSFQCSDGIDNDGDGVTDYPDDPDCTSPFDDTEGGTMGGATGGSGSTLTREQCADGIDNDGDGLIDYGNDPGCESWLDDDEGDIGGGDGAPDEDTTPVLPSTGPADAFALALIIAISVTYYTKSYKLQ